MYVVVVAVDIAAGQHEGSRQALQEQVIPRVSQAPGFVKGYWTAGSDLTRGMSFLLFGNQQDAENAKKMISGGGLPPMVTLVSAEVREVIAEA